MAVSLAGSISRAISGYNKDIRTHERAISTGKKTLSQLNPADLVQISSLFRATQGLAGARANIDIAISNLNTLANGIQNQLDIVNKAYALAEVAATNVNMPDAGTDRANLTLQYAALIPTAGAPGGAIDAAAIATTNINGVQIPTTNGVVGLAIDAIASTNPAQNVPFAAIDTGANTLFGGGAGQAANLNDLNTIVQARLELPKLATAQGILSNHLASIENQIDLLSSISDSLGDASDAAADTAKEIADTDPIEAANAIKNNQGAKNLLAGLLTNDAQDANNVMNYARGILALPV